MQDRLHRPMPAMRRSTERIWSGPPSENLLTALWFLLRAHRNFGGWCGLPLPFTEKDRRTHYASPAAFPAVPIPWSRKATARPNDILRRS